MMLELVETCGSDPLFARRFVHDFNDLRDTG
jgi:hypothetical protein